MTRFELERGRDVREWIIGSSDYCDPNRLVDATIMAIVDTYEVGGEVLYQKD